METVSLLNISDAAAGNSSLLREFPYWRQTLAISLISYIFVYASTLLLVYLPLLVLLAKMKNNNVHLKPLNVIHMSLLTFTIIEDVLIMIVYTNYLPSVH